MNRKQAYLAERILACGADLTAALRLLTTDELWYRPAPAEWNIHQVATHLVQTQRDRFLAIAGLAMREPGAPIVAFDADATMAAHYKPEIPLSTLLGEFRTACRRIARLVEAAAPADMRKVVMHPTRGPLSAEWWVTHAYGHTHEHIAQIVYNRDQFLRANSGG